MKNSRSNTFDTSALLKAAIPSYLVPLIMSCTSGLIMDRPEVVAASYSSIALPSLIATIITFFLLREFQKRQVFLWPRLLMTIFLGSTMVLFSLLIIETLGLQDKFWDVVPSAFIGTAIVTMSKPIVKRANYEHV